MMQNREDSQPVPDDKKIAPGETDEIVGHSQADTRVQPPEAEMPEGPPPGDLDAETEWRPSDEAEKGRDRAF